MSNDRRWEYHVLTFDPDDAGGMIRNLDEMGDQGWELVTIAPTELAVESLGNPVFLLAFFKRELD